MHFCCFFPAELTSGFKIFYGCAVHVNLNLNGGRCGGLMATSVPGTGVAASLELELIFTLATVHLSRAHLITRVTNTGNFRSLSEGY